MGGLVALLIFLALCVGAVYLVVRAWRWARRWRVRVDPDYRDDIAVKVTKGLGGASYNSALIARLKPNADNFEQQLASAKANAQARCNELNRAR